MAVYTVELRSLCRDSLPADFTSSNPVEIVNAMWERLLYADCPELTREDRERVFKKILLHFYMAEIGLETPDLWKLYINNFLSEISPYYGEMYRLQRAKLDPVKNFDLVRTTSGNTKTTKNANGQRTWEDSRKNMETGESSDIRTAGVQDVTQTKNTEKNSTSANSTETEKTTTSGENTEASSDTPCGSLSGVETLEYLTSAKKDNHKNSGDSSSTSKNSTTTDNTANGSTEYNSSRSDQATGQRKNSSSGNGAGKDSTTADELSTGENSTTEKLTGSSGADYGKLISSYKATIQNLDQEIIVKCNKFFMQIF